MSSRQTASQVPAGDGLTGAGATPDLLLRALVASTSDAILSFSPAGIITSWNPAAGRLLGYNQSEALGQHLRFLFPPESQVRLDEALKRLAEGAAVVDARLSRRRRDGAEFAVSLSVFRLEDSGGEELGFGAILRDVTQSHRTQAELEAAKIAAEVATNHVNEFLSRMSHELRTPLNVILGFGQILQLDPLKPDQEDAVEHILKAGRHLLDLVDEVLNISRIEAGSMTLSMEPVRIYEAVMEAVEMVRPLARQRGISIITEMEHCRGFVHADRQRLKQVLLNLLSNGLKYNNQNGTLHVSWADYGERIRLLIADTGPGIPEEAFDRLFQPFDRLGAEQSEVEGTGLGLPLSRRLANAMGGALGVESRIGEGSTFWVELARTEGDTAVQEQHTGGDLPLVPVVDRRRVLYIEDNLASFAVVERVLARRPNIEVMPALQARVGLDLAREYQPALILLDLHLPDMPGADVLRALKADPRTAGIPVVVASADATPGQRSRLLAAGAAVYLTKPIDIHELLRIVDDMEKLEAMS